ncbi:MAG: YegS/Rv2252/BmrU family lipid kinase [Myxococcota bacterium]
MASPRVAQRADLGVAIAHVRGRGHYVDTVVLDGTEQLEHIAQRLSYGRIDVVVAAGGDGTLNAVANVMTETRLQGVAMAALPLGTANDFATGLGITGLDLGNALALAAEGKAVPIDLGRVNGRLFVNFASGALGAEITAETPQPLKKVMGGAAYLATGFAVSLSKRPPLVRLRAPGFSWEGRVLYIGVGNARLAGGGFEVSRNAMLDDRLLDVTILPELGTWGDILGMVSQLVREHALPRDYSMTRQVPWLEIEALEGLQVNTDGEPMQATHYRFDLFERQVPFIMTANAQSTLTHHHTEVAA